MKIEILNPIEHDGKRFERGVVELADELAKIFLKFKHAARAALSAVETPAPAAGARGLPATPTTAPGKPK
ncbi:MAG: hypothetical protein ABSE79_07870 [Terriglobia bacterium]|jgi:hypothetical protein